MFYNMFIRLCEQKGVRPAQVAKELNLNQSTISMWKSQKTTPNAITIMRLSEYFNVTPAYLMGNEQAKGPLYPSRTDKLENDAGDSSKHKRVKVEFDDRVIVDMNDDNPDNLEFWRYFIKHRGEFAQLDKLIKQAEAEKDEKKKAEYLKMLRDFSENAPLIVDRIYKIKHVIEESLGDLIDKAPPDSDKED